MKFRVDKFGNDAFVPDNKVFEVDDFGNYVFLFPSASSITASIAETQAVQTEAIAGKVYFATIAESQAAQTEAIVASETYKATISETQSIQTEAITVSERYTTSIVEAQTIQSESITAAIPITADIAESQAVQIEVILGTVAVPVPVPVPFVGGGYGGLMPGFWTDKLIPELKRKKQPIPERVPEPVAVLTPQVVINTLGRLVSALGIQEPVSESKDIDGALVELHKILKHVKSLPPLGVEKNPEDITIEIHKMRLEQEDKDILDLIMSEVA